MLIVLGIAFIVVGFWVSLVSPVGKNPQLILLVTQQDLSSAFLMCLGLSSLIGELSYYFHKDE